MLPPGVAARPALASRAIPGPQRSPEALAAAARKPPFESGPASTAHRFSLPDGSVAVIVCALALVHVPHFEPVLAEFARVLRSGGDLAISDISLPGHA